MLIGSEVPEESLALSKQQMNEYSLKGSRLTIVQGGGERVSLDAIRSSVMEDFYKKSEQQLLSSQATIDTLKNQLASYTRYQRLSKELLEELVILYPSVKELSLSYGVHVSTKSAGQQAAQADTLTLAVLRFDSIPAPEDLETIQRWIKTRLGTQALRLITE